MPKLLVNTDFSFRREVMVLLISARVHRGSATGAVDSGSIPGWAKPKTIQVGIHSFRA